MFTAKGTVPKAIGIATLLGLAACVPFAPAGGCRAVYQPAQAGRFPAAAGAAGDAGTGVVTAPFEPLDVFVFVGPPTTPAPALALPAPAAAQPPAGGQGDADLRGMPRAVGYRGRGAPAAGAGVDPRAVAEALGSCAACHTAPAGKQGVNLFAASGVFDPKVPPAAVYAAVKDDSMPLRGPKLAAAQKQLIAAWAAQSEKKGP